MRIGLALLCPLAATVLACGSLSDVERRPPLAVVEGQLTQTSASGSTPPNVRIALLWVTHGATAFMTTQDVEATPVFPSKFRIDLTDPPPPEVTLHASDDPRAPTSAVPSTGAIAVGTLIAYEDRNGNGKLDLVDDDDPAFVDHVLGANADLSVVYVEGDYPAVLADPNGSAPALGYNLLRRTVCTIKVNGGVEPAAPGQEAPPPPAQPPCDQSHDGWLSISTLYDLPLTGDAKFETAMCKRGGIFYSGFDSTEPPPKRPDSGTGDFYPPHYSDIQPWPPKGDPLLSCALDGRSYGYKTCTYESQGLCQPPLSSCTTAYWGLQTTITTPPPEWPCPIP